MADELAELQPDYVRPAREIITAEAKQTLDAAIESFNGAIKYTPMLQDRPDLTHDECVEFAQKWHAVVIERLRLALRREREEGVAIEDQQPRWNEGVPYCRNIPTQAMLDEAAK